MDNLSRRVKVLLGILSIWPLVYMGLLVVGGLAMAVFVSQTTPPGHAHHPPAHSPASDTARFAGFAVFAVIASIHMLTIFLMMGLTVFYLVHVVQTERLTQDERVLWGIIVFLGGAIAQVVYWYLNIWREPRPRTEKPAASGILFRRARRPMGIAMLFAALWFVVFMAYMESAWPSHGSAEFGKVAPAFIIVFVLHGIATLCLLAVTALCLAHAVGNRRLSKKSKIVWALILFFLWIPATPVYWYLHIWRKQEGELGAHAV